MNTAPLICIDRHRLTIDGEGVTTLVAFMVVLFIASIVSIHNVLKLTAYGKLIQNC